MQPEWSTCGMEEQSDSCLGARSAALSPSPYPQEMLKPEAAGSHGCAGWSCTWMEQVLAWKREAKGPSAVVFMLAWLIGRALAL